MRCTVGHGQPRAYRRGPRCPLSSPLVHALVWNLDPDGGRLPEGAIVKDGAGGPKGEDVGRNSFFAKGWLPPDPPTGHGPHDYVFQLFALSDTPGLDSNPGRETLATALEGRVLAAGILIGTYSRGEDTQIGLIGSPGPALV